MLFRVQMSPTAGEKSHVVNIFEFLCKVSDLALYLYLPIEPLLLVVLVRDDNLAASRNKAMARK